MNRREFLSGATGVSILSIAGCMGYVGTNSEDYCVVKNTVHEDGDEISIVVDAEYTGDKNGNVQYKMGLYEGETLVKDSGIFDAQKTNVKPGRVRFTKRMDKPPGFNVSKGKGEVEILQDNSVIGDC